MFDASASVCADARWEARVDRTRVVFGAASLEQLADEVGALGGRRVLLVTDPGVRAEGHVERAVGVLKAVGLPVTVFDGVAPNPTTRHVDAGRDVARRAGVDSIVALGGGSAMDCAKGINFLLTNGGSMADYRGFGTPSRPLLPSLGVPTTAGTGSDAQSYALIADDATHLKMACGAPGARFGTVLIDPTLARTAPRDVVSVSGVDAMSHAIESFVCTRSNPMSRLYAQQAWRLLERDFPRVLADAGDVDAWGRMLWAAHLAGAAIEQSMLGAAHACANPLTARYGVTHGAAVGVMLPAVIEFNDPVVGSRYRELIGDGTPLVDRVRGVLRAAGVTERVRDHAVPREALGALAREAATQWTAGYNPRPVSEAELLALYEASW